MKVVLLTDIKALGKKGDIKEVSDGYAANMLIPKGFAQKASAGALNEVTQSKQAQEHKHQELLSEANATKKRLEGEALVFNLKFGAGGKAFGGISSKEICEELAARGIEVDKKKIEIDGALKAAGAYRIKVKLYGGVTAEIKITIS